MLMKPIGYEPVTASATLTQIVSYRDQQKAIDFLCATFGFQPHNIATHPDGSIEHALLTLGGGTIMLVPSHDMGGRTFVQPDTIGGAETQACYFTVFDIEQHYERARHRGADIVWPLQDMGYGGVCYAARDAEGHVWSFGNYNPKGDGASVAHGSSESPMSYAPTATDENRWVGDATAETGAAGVNEGDGIVPSAPPPARSARRAFSFGLASIAVAALCAVAFEAGPWKSSGDTIQLADAMQAVARLQESVAREQALKDAAASQVAVLEGKLKQVTQAKSEAERSASVMASGLRLHIESLEGSLASAERANKDVHAELASERAAKEAALVAQKVLMAQLETATRAQEQAEAVVAEMRDQLHRLETALAESEASSKAVATELAALRQAKVAAQNEVDGMRQLLSSEQQAKEEAGRKFDLAIADLRLQLEAEQKARGLAETSAVQLRSKLETAEQAKTAAAREIAKIETKAGAKVRRAKAGKPKKIASESKPKAASNSGAAAKNAKFSDASTSKTKKKDLEVWEYASPVWQDSSGSP